MNVVCLDMEGVLYPEIWIAFSEESGIPELRRTTRDEPDYDKLMKWRINLLRERGLKLKDVQNTIAKIHPLPGAKEFLDELRTITQVIIVSDTFSQFAEPLMRQLDWPAIFCNELMIDIFLTSGCAATIPSSLPSGRCSPSATIPSLRETATMISR